MPIPVLYCIDALPRGGGTENQVADLVRHLDRQLVVPHVCTLKTYPGTAQQLGCASLDLDVGRLFAPRGLTAVRRLGRFIHENRIAVVQTFFQDATILGGWTAWMAQVPVRLASFRDLGFWRTPRLEFLMRRTYPVMTGFVANSQAVRSHFCDRDGIAPERVAVIPNGLAADEIAFQVRPGPVTDIGIVGNINRPIKRIDLFVEAAGLLAAEFPRLRWHLLGDGHLRPQLENRATELGIADRTVFAGRVADIPGYLQRLQIGVLCSDSEGFSNAILEYMAAGAAVVATDVGGNAEAVVSEETGILVRPGDAYALAAGLRRVLNDDDLRLRLAARARERVVAQYSWDRCVERHVALYRRSLTAAGAAWDRL